MSPARELLIKGVTMDLGFNPTAADLPSREQAMAALEQATPLQLVGYAAQGLKIWGALVEGITLEVETNGGRMRPGKERMVTGSRECLAVFCEAYAAALRELAAASLVTP